MSVTSDLEIRLHTDVARLQTDMTQVRTAVNGTMASIRNAVGGAAKAFAALAVGVGIGAFAGWIKGAIDAVDAIGDISPATGVAIKDIAGLQMAFQFGGLEAKDFEKTMIKLSSAIAAGDDGFARIGVATKAAGGDLRESKAVLYDVADAFAKLQDGTAKTALASELFGEKVGPGLIPMLNNGSEGLRQMAEMADKLGLSFTQAGVDAAGQFNDSLDTIGLMSQGVGRQVATQLLPTLNALVGSFVTLATEGNGVRKMADVIGGGFKLIYTGALAVGQVFDTLSSVIAISLGTVMDGFGTAAKTLKLFIEGNYSEALQAATTGAKAIAASNKKMGSEMVDSWSSTAAAISGVWSGASGKVVEDMAAIQRAGKLAAKATKEQEAAAKKAASEAEAAAKQEQSAYESMITAIKEKVAANALELKGYSTLTESQKATIKLDTEIATGKSKLSAQSIANVRAEIVVLAAQEDALKTMVMTQEMSAAAVAGAAKADNDFYDSLRETTKAIDGQITTMREQISVYGLTETAVADLALAKAEAAMAAGPASYAELIALDQQIEKLKELRSLTGSKAGLEAAKAVTDEQKKMLESLDKTAHDTFVSIADGGKGAAQRLKDAFKNVFFDWLYQQTVKKWVFNAEAKTSGGSGGVDAGFLSNLSGGLSGASGATGLGAALGKGAASVLGPSISGALSTGLGALATAAPWIAGALAVVSIAKKAFGHGPKEFTGNSTLNGSLGDSFSGTVDSEWKKKGGWFSSSKTGTDKAAVGADMASGLTAAYSAIKAASTAYAEVLGLNAASIATRTQAISIALGKDDAANQKAIADFFTGVADAVAVELLPNIAKFAAQGEAASTTLQRLAGNFQMVDAVLTTLGVNSQQAFGAVGAASIEARERLIALAGGVDALAAQMNFFTDNFLTEAQKIAPVQKMVTEQLAALGYSGITTADQFRDAVLKLATTGQLATAQGAGLLALAPAFKQLTDYLGELEGATKAAAEAAKEAADAIAQELVNSLRAAAGTAFDTLGRSIAAKKDVLRESFDALMESFDKRIGVSNGRIASLQGLQTALKGARTGAADTTGMARQMAQAQIGAVLAIARASGVLPEASALEDALRAVGGDATNQFSSMADFQRDQLRTANQIEELAALTDGQLTVEQKTLAALIEQKTQAQIAYAADVAGLDATLAAAQLQLDAVNGVNTSVLSIVTALAQFTASFGAAMGNTTVSQQAGMSQAAQIESMYQTMLGRPSDAGGMQFYLDALKTGSTMADIAGYFAKSPEYQGLYTAQQPRTTTTSEGSAMLTELQTMNQRLANVESATRTTSANTGKTAEQIDSISAGGGALRVEMA